jgi:GR25 family glycosyltransferase involved in LPS biosynthesis
MSNPFDFFDEIYCINLPSSVERWNTVSETFTKLGIMPRVKRIVARPPDADIIQATPEGLLRLGINFNPIGMLGCSLSHLKILTKVLNNRSSNVLIFEDDVMFTDVFSFEKLNNAILELPPTWDILFLGADPVQPTLKYSENLIKVTHTWGSYAYALNQKCISHICTTTIDNLTQGGLDYCLSIFSSDLLEKFCITPRMCTDSPGVSTMDGIYHDWNIESNARWNEFVPK